MAKSHQSFNKKEKDKKKQKKREEKRKKKEARREKKNKRLKNSFPQRGIRRKVFWGGLVSWVFLTSSLF